MHISKNQKSINKGTKGEKKNPLQFNFFFLSQMPISNASESSEQSTVVERSLWALPAAESRAPSDRWWDSQQFDPQAPRRPRGDERVCVQALQLICQHSHVNLKGREGGERDDWSDDALIFAYFMKLVTQFQRIMEHFFFNTSNWLTLREKKKTHPHLGADFPMCTGK